MRQYKRKFNGLQIKPTSLIKERPLRIFFCSVTISRFDIIKSKCIKKLRLGGRGVSLFQILIGMVSFFSILYLVTVTQCQGCAIQGYWIEVTSLEISPL